MATVEHSTEPQWIRVTADGHDAVLFQVYQQPSGNTVEIARGIKAKLREIGKQIPEGVKIADWYDQSDLIIASEHSTRDAMLIGMMLAAFVLLVFLRDWKVTLIAILTVPAVLAATIVLLLRPENEFQHHDTRRHGRCRRPDHRRRNRDGGTYRATRARCAAKAIRARAC